MSARTLALLWLAGAALYVLYLLLYPSALVIWRHRVLLKKWAWMTMRHPILMFESAHEVRREDRP